MRERKGPGYFNPSPEQVAASRARRAEQKAFSVENKTKKYYTRVGGGVRAGLKEHRRASGKMAEAVGAATLGSAGAFYLLNRNSKKPVSKADRNKKAENYALGAAGGTGAGFVAMGAGGHAVKATLKERRAKRGQSPYERDVWDKHMKANVHNVAPKPNGKPNPNRWKAYAKYPKELKDWRAQRALAFKNRPAVSAGIVAAGTAGGLAYAHHRNKNLGGQK